MVQPPGGGGGDGRRARLGDPHTTRPVTQAAQDMNGRNAAMKSARKFRWTHMFIWLGHKVMTKVTTSARPSQ